MISPNVTIFISILFLDRIYKIYSIWDKFEFEKGILAIPLSNSNFKLQLKIMSILLILSKH